MIDPRLQIIADSFLLATNPVFQECSEGVFKLKRIVVSVAAVYSDDARAFLLPGVYAFWERFFRVAMTEFISSISKGGFLPGEVSQQISIRGLKQKSSMELSLLGIKGLDALSPQQDISRIQKFFEEVCSWIKSPISFPDPSELVDTSINVRYELVESNFKLWGIEVNRIKEIVRCSNYEIYPALKGLVDRRNEIAHGNVFSPCSMNEWGEQTDLVLALMNGLQMVLYETLVDKQKILK